MDGSMGAETLFISSSTRNHRNETIDFTFELLWKAPLRQLTV